MITSGSPLAVTGHQATTNMKTSCDFCQIMGLFGTSKPQERCEITQMMKALNKVI